MSPSFFTSLQVTECSIPARLLFAGLWCLADREGRLVDDPWRIRIAVFPTDAVDLGELLDELAGRGLIVRYRAEGQSLIAIPTFAKWQHLHPRESASGLPGPEKANLGSPLADQGWKVRAKPSKPSKPSGSSRDKSPNGDSGVAVRIFGVWQSSTGHTKARMTPSRSRLISARVRDGFDEGDLADAASGVALDPWPERIYHNGFEVVFRDAAHVEKFRDFARNGVPVPVAKALPENPIDRRIRESFSHLTHNGDRP